MSKGNLYLIPSPIGNINDVSPRIREAISNVEIIACEDTRNTMRLLQILGYKKQCISCHEHNEIVSSQNIIKLLNEGKNIGYLSDAGYPCISDPGYILTKDAIENGITVFPISGPSAFLNALVASGISTEHFFFYGFLKSKSNERKKELELLKNFSDTIIFYEAPHRINETISDIYEIFGERKISIAREISKIHEEFIRGRLSDFVKNKREYIGELVIVIEGNVKITTEEIDDNTIIRQVETLIKNGINKKEAILCVSICLNVPKNRVKKLFI